MINQKTDGKFFFGTVVVNDDDPYEMGRVRICIPQLHGPEIDKTKMPLVQLASNANQEGQISFDRPPQVGTTVLCYYPHGSASNPVVLHTFNGIPNPGKTLPGNLNLYKAFPWLKEALEQPQSVFGNPDLIQELETNLTGVEKVITKVVDSRIAPSIIAKSGLPSNVLSQIEIPFDRLKQVATATQSSVAAMSQSLVDQIPGINFGVSQLLSVLQGNNTALDSVVSNLQGIIGENTPLSGTNFMHLASSRLGSSGDTSAMLSRYSELNDVTGLLDLLGEVASGANTVLQGLSSESKNFSANTAFGEISFTVDESGNFTLNIPDSILTAINNMVNSLSSVQNAISTVLSDTEILGSMRERLDTEGQTLMRELVAELETLKTKIEETK